MSRYVVLTILVFALAAPPAAASGSPAVGGDAGPAGVTMPDLAHRWVAVRVRSHTLIAAIERQGGRIAVTRIVREPLVVPAVAYDRSATGLSADGTTLVLARESSVFPPRRSSFAILDANTLAPLTRVTLRGDFTLDAVSPDGGRLYLIQAKTPTRYAVRAYDLARRRLLPGAIVDPEEADEPMEGNPLARAMSRDGRWAYTLYDVDGAEFFIHALDTERGAARCIDLDGIDTQVDDLRVGRDGALVLTAASEVVRRVELRPPRTSAAAAGAGATGVAVGVALLALLAVAAARAGAVRSR